LYITISKGFLESHSDLRNPFFILNFIPGTYAKYHSYNTGKILKRSAFLYFENKLKNAKI